MVILASDLGNILKNIFRSFSVDFAVSFEINLVPLDLVKPLHCLVLSTPT
jgi:hypothetical protein